jgi:hydrogenase maturation protein HypF
VNGLRIRATGTVQGVGFRPYVYNLALRHQLTGWVCNSPAGVEIEVDGTRGSLDAFVRALRAEVPTLAQVESWSVEDRPANGHTEFRIVESRNGRGGPVPIPTDIATCPECLRELFDPADRRYRYPFINCTQCGPRYTILRDLPYDRPLTTMADFALCPDCAREYQDPSDRRFHAQPVACPACGPQLWLEAEGRVRARGASSLELARRLLRRGGIVAIKGLGGYHLACDAYRTETLDLLRSRKRRWEKPFALMYRDLESLRADCQVSDAERALLTTPQRPIVILERLPGSCLPQAVAPGQRTIGAMLPYTPLHHLLLEGEGRFPPALVMTSGNRSDEPMAIDEAQARTQLHGVADAFLMHDRPIHSRCDDSVERVVAGAPYSVRRGRGRVPQPIRWAWEADPVLACGAAWKNTFCLARGSHAYLSPHIGDLENAQTLEAYEAGIAHLERLTGIRPELLACDLHPDYLSTRYALERAEREQLPLVRVQHHHAHIAAGMADARLAGDRRVIGVAFDGTGYGDDGTAWGGEFLLADYAGYERRVHLTTIPLAGGDSAARQPWRMALAWSLRAGIDDLPDLPFWRATPAEHLRVVEQLLGPGARQPILRAPLTSSMGRLFDAVASLAGVRHLAREEGQAAIELEALIDPDEARSYEFRREEQAIDPGPVIRAIVDDLRQGTSTARISARFHNAVARMVAETCAGLSRESGLTDVVLSGGVWQNVSLLTRTVPLLRAAGLSVHLHRQVPPNDGGLSLGQAAVAAWTLRLRVPPGTLRSGQAKNPALPSWQAEGSARPSTHGDSTPDRASPSLPSGQAGRGSARLHHLE